MRKSYRGKIVYIDLKCNFMKVEKQFGGVGGEAPKGNTFRMCTCLTMNTNLTSQPVTELISS